MKDLQMDDIVISKMVDEIMSYVSPEVNIVEASAFYMEKHHIDTETFASIIKSNPVLWSSIYETGVRNKSVKQTQSMLLFV